MPESVFATSGPPLFSSKSVQCFHLLHTIVESVTLPLAPVPGFLERAVISEGFNVIVEDIARNWDSHILLDFKAIIFTVKFPHCHCVT